MPGFVLCWDESQEQYYAFRSLTGETIYGASEVACILVLPSLVRNTYRLSIHPSTSI